MAEIKFIKPKQDGTRVMFLCRLSYAHLGSPRSGVDGGEPKYSTVCIVPKADTATMAAINSAIKAAYDQGVIQKWKGQRPNIAASNFKNPLKDGDIDKGEDPVYAQAYFVSANSKSKVPVFDRARQPIDPSLAYSGCYAVVSVNFYPFEQGSKGIACGLNAVLKFADGERLSGGMSDGSEFEGMDLGEESLEDL